VVVATTNIIVLHYNVTLNCRAITCHGSINGIKNLHVDNWFLNNNNHCDNKFVTTKCGLAILMRTFHGH